MLTFTLELKGAPVTKASNYIQFKIKPVNSSDKITVSVQSKDGKTTTVALKETKFSDTDKAKLEKGGDGNYYVLTPLMKAYKQAFIETSGEETGWYQVSVPSGATGDKIVITLTSPTGFPAGSKIGMDDLTIQFASTIGELLFSSDNATATGDCLIHLK